MSKTIEFRMSRIAIRTKSNKQKPIAWFPKSEKNLEFFRYDSLSSRGYFHLAISIKMLLPTLPATTKIRIMPMQTRHDMHSMI